jgi:hypothetical protein
MTFTIPRADWVSDTLVAERGEYAGFQMFTREGNDAVAALLHHVLRDADRLAVRRSVAVAAIVQGLRTLSARFPEVYDTEPEWAIVDACQPFFAEQGWVQIGRDDLS